MTVKDQMLLDTAHIFDVGVFGCNAIYYGADGSQKEIVMVKIGGSDLADYVTGAARITHVYVKKSDIYHPLAGDEILDLETNWRWTVSAPGIADNNQVLWKLTLTGDHRTKTSA